MTSYQEWTFWLLNWYYWNILKLINVPGLPLTDRKGTLQLFRLLHAAEFVMPAKPPACLHLKNNKTLAADTIAIVIYQSYWFYELIFVCKKICSTAVLSSGYACVSKTFYESLLEVLIGATPEAYLYIRQFKVACVSLVL